MKKNTIRYILLLAILILIFLLGQYALTIFKENKKNTSNILVVDEIKDYGYSLNNKDTDLYKTTFNELKTILNGNKDEIKYAEAISKLFIIDFYTLDNKINNSDIGGLEFVNPIIVENFKLKAKDTIYKYIESNIYGNRKQELPIVKNISIVETNKTSYKYNQITDTKAYQIKIKIEYSKDLGYDTLKTLYLVHEGSKLSLIEME